MNRTWKNVLCTGGMILAGCAAIVTGMDTFSQPDYMDREYRYEYEQEFPGGWYGDNDFDFDFDEDWYERDYRQDRNSIEEYFDKYEQQSWHPEVRYEISSRHYVDWKGVVLLIEELGIFGFLLVWMIVSKGNKLSWNEAWHPTRQAAPTVLPVTPDKQEQVPDVPKAAEEAQAEEKPAETPAEEKTAETAAETAEIAEETVEAADEPIVAEEITIAETEETDK